MHILTYIRWAIRLIAVSLLSVMLIAAFISDRPASGSWPLAALLCCALADTVLAALIYRFSSNNKKNDPNSLYSLQETLRQKCDELDALREVSQVITSTFEVESIIRYIYRVFNRFTGCDRYLICFMDHEKNRLVCRYEFGTVILGEVDRIVEPTSIISRCFNEHRTLTEINTFIKTRSIYGDKMAMPLEISADTIGVLFIECGRPKAFEALNIAFLESLGAYAAIAIKNAELFNNIYLQKQENEALYEQTAAVNQELQRNYEELAETKEQLRQKNEELTNFYRELRTGYTQTVVALAKSIEVTDAYTRNHCERVLEISCVLAKYLGLNENEVESLRYAAILHDIGKIGIPAYILNKKSALTNEEFAIIKQHPLIAFNILKDIQFLKSALGAILEHHERFDGSGYPNGLKGDKISLPGRILCIADAFDAMTSDRPYRKGMSMEAAIKEIRDNKGRQFDPHIAELLISLVEEGKYA